MNKRELTSKEIAILKEQELDTTPRLETFEKLHNKRPKDMTRREMLSSGVMSFAATLAAPSALTLLTRNANAQVPPSDEACKAIGKTPLGALIELNAAGGMAMGANWLPLGPTGSFLKSYSKLGGGTVPRTATEFKPDTNGKQALFFQDSQFLAGLRATAAATTLTSTHFVGVPLRMQDDSANNPASISGLVLAAGRQGELMKNMGPTNSTTGINMRPAITPPPSPLVVRDQGSIRGALGFQSVLAGLTEQQQTKIMRTIATLSSHQASKLVSDTGGATLQKLLGCANIDNAELIANQSTLDIDPVTSPPMRQIYGLTPQSNPASQAYVFASIAYNTVLGRAATGGIVMGGFDYHNGTRITGDARDFALGQEAGRLLEAAVQLNLTRPAGQKQKVFIIVMSDGAATGPESSDPGGIWSTDYGVGSAVYMMAYDPDQMSKATTTQLSFFNDAQAATDTFVWGSNIEKAMAAICVNYLSFNNQFGLVQQVMPSLFQSSEIDKIRVLFPS